METLLSNFPFSFLLRSFFAGVFFALPTVILGNTFAQSEEDSSLTWIAVSLISGVIIYSIHRAIIYPAIEWFLESDCVRRPTASHRCCIKKVISCLCKHTLISNNTKKSLRARWLREAGGGDSAAEKSNEIFAKQISVWADYTHMLYVSSWCTVLGILVACLASHFYPESGSGLDMPLRVAFCIFALVFLCSGFVSDYRLHQVEDDLRNNKKCEA